MLYRKIFSTYKNRLNLNHIIFSLILLASSLVFIYSFWLSKKRYDNFIFGKFDLGNMTQIAWNTSQGRFMQVTDQFGGNIPRYGMSHVDLILAIVSPFFWIYPSPMLLVALQNIFIISGAIPIYLLLKHKTNSSLISACIAFAYLLYPANGFLLVWSEYHGVAHTAPIFLWMFYLLEKWEYKFVTFKNAFIFWLLFFVTITGKEQIGFMLGLFGAYVFLKKRKLGIIMFAIGMIYSFFCFLVLIPAYKNTRTESLNSFLTLLDQNNINEQLTTGDNFFLNRYSYMGTSYKEIVLNIANNPEVLTTVAFEKDKVQNLKYLLQPFGYVALVSPVWLIASPDYLIALLADVKGFLSIENQRVSFMIVTLFASFAVVLILVNSKVGKYKIAHILAVGCLASTIYTSVQSQNPLITNGYSFVQNKIVKKVFSQTAGANKISTETWQSKSGRIPDTNIECYKQMLSLVNEYNPSHYSGPDNLGAHTAMRETNALFPAALDHSDMFITSLFDLKAYKAVQTSIEPIELNRNVVRKVMAEQNFKHVYSCGQLSAFVKGQNTDNVQSFREYTDQNPFIQHDVVSTKLILKDERIADIFFYTSPDKKTNNLKAEYSITKRSNTIAIDKVGYWKFIDKKTGESFSFFDYTFWGHNIDWASEPEDESYVHTYDFSFMQDMLEDAEYAVYYGIGDQVRAIEAYAFDL